MRAPRRILFGLLCALLALITVAGCASSGGSGGGGEKAPDTPAVSAAQITVAHSDGQPINPIDPIEVTATGGQLTDVQVTNPEGVAVPGVLTPDGDSWKTNEPLGYDKAYTVVATATDSKGLTTTATKTVTTLAPSNQTKVYFENTGGNAIDPDTTYGVGMVVAAHFDEPIADKAAAQKTLTVTTTPQVEGSWNWVNDTTAHWRPKEYYPAGTQVSVTAKLYGVDVGGGMYGQEDESIAFKIGDSHVSIADDNTKMVTVYKNGQEVRTMPTSMGMGGTQEIGGQTFTFWTQPGVYTVLGMENPVVMDSSTYGLPINSRLGYKEVINWATRISNDGIYLHALDATIADQGVRNVSHGCLNLSTPNAEWFFDFSQPGDVVEVKNTGGEPLQIWQNGDWTVSWADWVAGSAL